MITNNSSVISLTVDTGDATATALKLGNSLIGLQKEAERVGSSITTALSPIITSLKEICSGVQSISNLLQETSASIANVTSAAAEGTQTSGFFENIKGGYNVLISFIKSIEGFDSSNGKLTTFFEELVTAPNISNLLKSMLPKTTILTKTVEEWVQTSLVPTFSTVFKGLGTTVAFGSETLLVPLKNAFHDIGPQIGSKLSSVLDSIQTTFSGTAINNKPIAELSQTLAQAGDTIANVSGNIGGIGNVLSNVGSKIGSFGQSISGIFGSITTSISGMSLGWGAVIALVIGFVIGLVVVIVQNWDAIKAAIGTAAEWLNTNVIQPIVGFCTELWTNITTIISGIWNGIVSVFSVVGQWIYDNVIVPVMDIFSPIIEWYAQLFGSVWQTISDIFYNIGVVICGCWEIIKAAWAIVATWFNENVIQPVVQFFVQLGTSIAEFATNAWTAICNTFSAVGTWFYENVIKPVGSFISDMWNGFLQGALNAWEGIKSAFSAVAGFFGDIFGKAWAAVVKVFDIAGEIFVNIKDGILSVFKTIVNGLIDGINAVVAIPFKGINGALSIIKNIEIVGITPFSDLRLLNIPKIPHLAQGAVLPANRPFMAIVGDQRHGTNVEAPLATIQEAVAVVMEDQTAAIVAGFNASIGIQRELLSAVLGIRIGDEVIGRAADRYFAKRAAMGGY